MTPRAVVIGGGPNGLAAAAMLAVAGTQVTLLEAESEIGGGLRSGPETLPGLLYDHCSSVHILAVGSRLFQTLNLEGAGVRWSRAEIDCAHPLDSGDAALLYQDVRRTADGLGIDGPTWQTLFGHLSNTFAEWKDDILGPALRLPRSVSSTFRFASRAALPVDALARVFRTAESKAAFAGVAAHSMRPFRSPMSSAVGMGLVVAGHKNGWVFAKGGSQKIAQAMAEVIRSHGGQLITGHRVASIEDIPPSDVVVADIPPHSLVQIFGRLLPHRYRRAFQSWHAGPAVFKVSLAVDGGIPWTNGAVRAAGTVHVGGFFDEISRSLDLVNAGSMPEEPFVVVTQPQAADPGRSLGNLHPVTAYAHVPSGYRGDATDQILRQIDRFAPGVSGLVRSMSTTTPAEFERSNANFARGGILSGQA